MHRDGASTFEHALTLRLKALQAMLTMGRIGDIRYAAMSIALLARTPGVVDRACPIPSHQCRALFTRRAPKGCKIGAAWAASVRKRPENRELRSPGAWHGSR